MTTLELEDTDVVVSVRRKAGTGTVCSGCGQPMLFVHDHHAERRVRDFPAWGRRCFLSVHVVRVDCPSCGVVTERLDWLEKGCRRTVRYEKYVARLCNYMPVLDVAGILAYFTHRITNGVSEGINNKIKVLKRRSNGFHDYEYFPLKILNATGALPSLESLDHPRF